MTDQQTQVRWSVLNSQASNENEADLLHSVVNSAHPRIQFDIEKPNTSPNGQSLSLLDFTVTIKSDGKTQFEFYKKKAKKPIFLNYKSAIPKKTKRNIIRNELRRIDQRCSHPTTKEKHLKEFEEVLSLNYYPNNFIKDIIFDNAPQRQHEPSLNSQDDWLYLRSPYISDTVDRKIASVFKDEGFSVRVVHSLHPCGKL